MGHTELDAQQEKGQKALKSNVAVITQDAWGWELACLALKNGHHVSVYHVKPGADFSILGSKAVEKFKQEGLNNVHSLELLLADAEFVLLSLSAAAMPNCIDAIAPFVLPNQSLVYCARSLAPETNHSWSAELSQKTCLRQTACMAGPAVAEDLKSNNPAAVVVGSRFPGVFQLAHQVWATPWFRVYGNRHVLGVELAHWMSGVYAVGAGAASGLKAGPTADGLLASRILSEFILLARALGEPATVMAGMAGVGQMMAHGHAKHNPDFKLGENLCKQKSGNSSASKSKVDSSEIQFLFEAVMHIAKTAGIGMPVTSVLYQMIIGKLAPQEVLSEFMSRTQIEEI
jgi:glycerol-3-phosphate dehydrogenase (NAD(P)+)